MIESCNLLPPVVGLSRSLSLDEPMDRYLLYFHVVIHIRDAFFLCIFFVFRPNKIERQDTARERVFLDGKEMAFWGSSPSDKPNSWHEELWATIEARVRDGLMSGNAASLDSSKPSDKNDDSSKEKKGGWGWRGTGRGVEGVGGGGGGVGAGNETPAVVVVDKARALASEEWNKARAVATTSEVFKAMSRTGAGGDAYFALVALFCTADKLVVPVHCQESPITVEFINGSSSSSSLDDSSSSSSSSGGKGWSRPNVASRTTVGAKGGGGGRTAEDVHVVVTVPSTFDIYLRDGRAADDVKGGSGGGRGSGSGGGGKNSRIGGVGGSGVYRKGGGGGGGHGGADASIALHLVRVKAVVEEEIWVVGSSRVPASSSSVSSAGGGKGGRTNGSLGGAAGSGAGGSGGGGGPKKSIEDDAPPTLRFLMEIPRDRASYGGGSGSKSSSIGNLGGGGGRSLDSRRASSDSAAHRAGEREGGGRRESGGGSSSPAGTPPPAPPAPLLTLTRTERRMRVSMVPEPSAVSEMMRNFSRKMGVDMPGPQPPRVLGC